MQKRLMLLILICIFLTASSSLALAGFEPIYPIYDTTIGGYYSYDKFKYQPYISSVYDFSNEKVYYNVGAKFKYNDQLFFDLGYDYGLNDSIEGYLYQQGVEGKLYYYQDLKTAFRFSLFSGKVGKSFSKEVKTQYINLNYNKELFNDWENKANLTLDITSGQATKTADNYYISNLSVPIKYYGFRIIPRLGYSKESDLIKPYYNLGSYVKGYDNYDSSDDSKKMFAQRGNRMASIAIEKEIELFPYTSIPVLNLLNGVVSVHIGDVLNKQEKLKELGIHSSIGAGLALNLGVSSMRLERFVTDQKESKTLFYFKANY